MLLRFSRLSVIDVWDVERERALRWADVQAPADNLNGQDLGEALTAQESVRLAVAKIKILLGVVHKNVVVFDADGLAKARLVARLAA